MTISLHHWAGIHGENRNEAWRYFQRGGVTLQGEGEGTLMRKMVEPKEGKTNKLKVQWNKLWSCPFGVNCELHPSLRQVYALISWPKEWHTDSSKSTLKHTWNSVPLDGRRSTISLGRGKCFLKQIQLNLHFAWLIDSLKLKEESIWTGEPFKICFLFKLFLFSTNTEYKYS